MTCGCFWFFGLMGEATGGKATSVFAVVGFLKQDTATCFEQLQMPDQNQVLNHTQGDLGTLSQPPLSLWFGARWFGEEEGFP